MKRRNAALYALEAAPAQHIVARHVSFSCTSRAPLVQRRSSTRLIHFILSRGSRCGCSNATAVLKFLTAHRTGARSATSILTSSVPSSCPGKNLKVKRPSSWTSTGIPWLQQMRAPGGIRTMTASCVTNRALSRATVARSANSMSMFTDHVLMPRYRKLSITPASTTAL